MRFKGYIINEGRAKKITEHQLLKGITKDCKKMVAATQKGIELMRGTWMDDHPFGFVDPKKFYRMSANANNLYTLIIDNHPLWKKYPKRSESIICSTSRDTSGNYGDLYYIFPKDGSNYGICSSNDIWGGFEKTFGDGWLDNMGKDIDKFARMYNVDAKALNGDNYRDLVMFLTELDEVIFTEEVKLNYIIPWVKNYYDNDMLKMLQEILDPKANGFKATKDPNRLPKPSSDGGREVWTDGASYMVHEDYLGKYGMDPIWNGER